MGVVPPMLSLAEPAIRDLQLVVLVHWWKCTAVEDGILVPLSLDMPLE
jgi:hypothetical protein